jgi:hypothetical protein
MTKGVALDAGKHLIAGLSLTAKNDSYWFEYHSKESQKNTDYAD